MLTGATGYIGGRLLRRFEQRGVTVRCLVRRLRRDRPAAATTSFVEGDVRDAAALAAALDGIRAAYYLVHALGRARDFERADREAAQQFGAAARHAGVERIIYLGGLGRGPDLSPHLRSRQEVGAILRASGVPTIEFQASIVIGDGSVSFEMVRALTNRLPVMITPRWVNTRAQPIAIADLLDYLERALTVPLDGSVLYQVGGADRVTYGDIMQVYARHRGLRRVMIPVPVLSPRLSSYWLALVTPLYASVGRELLEGVRNPTVVEDDAARRAFPDIHPRGIDAAVADALGREAPRRQ